MNYFLRCAILMALVSLVAWGCARSTPDDIASAGPTVEQHDLDHGDHDHAGHDHDEGPGHEHEGNDDDLEHAVAAGEETVAVALFCGTCGNAKGGESCCVEGAEKCEKCGMTVGSTLCCKLDDSFAGKDLCGKCGQVAGTEQCCAEGAEVCASCSLHKGSPLCCKLARSDPPESAPEK